MTVDPSLPANAAENAPAARDDALARYGVLDTPKEQAFEDIVKMAAIAFSAPIAVINLIDKDRQWFKAETGLGVRETPLDVSICTHALAEGGTVVVPDLTSDERFAQNPLVTGTTRLRFYAGAPLVTPEGVPLGTLCVLGRASRPNGITDDQRFTLEALARQVMNQFEANKKTR